MPQNPQIYVAIKPSLYNRLFDRDADKKLQSIGNVVFEPTDGAPDAATLAAKIKDVDAVVTGWGTPAFDDKILNNANRLRLIAHSAGTIKHLLPKRVFTQEISVTHAAAAIAPAVADYSLLLTMTMLRRSYEFHESVRQGQWGQGIPTGTEIGGQRIGVIAASYTGRFFIKLLKALEADVWVFDPYLTPEKAADLGVRKAGLDEMLSSCRVISLQAPVTDETRRMLGKRELALMREGSILINTARSLLVDQQALLDELKSGRISAALDVFDQEPLPADNPFRALKNVHLSSHVAGGSVQAAKRQGQYIADEVRRFFSGEPLKYAVRQEMLATMA
jgi:phosphoglycerate dehydrogenase-like enzyme